MAVPTDPTKVFNPVVVNSPSSGQLETTNFPVDLLIEGENSQSTQGNWFDVDRLRGSSSTSSAFLVTDGTSAENTLTHGFGFDNNTGVTDYWNSFAGVADNVTYWNFARATGFFDIVCYTGTASGPITINHNLGVIPQLAIIKTRNYGSTPAAHWYVGSQYLPQATTPSLFLETSDAANVAMFTGSTWSSSTTTSTITLSSNLNAGLNYVAYLFATCAGVSKVGSYTGTGGTQAIACGFGAGGARFILAKRTDATGDWYVFDSANGLTSSSSPYITWDTNNAQTTGNNGTYASSGGFTLTSASPVNTSGGTFIFLAIA
jgi:hypothetical protein